MHISNKLPVILLVDDDEQVLTSLGTIFEKKFKVLTAKSCKEALNTVYSKYIDVVFLDIKLPDANGIDVLCKIKSYNNDIPVIMATAVDNVKTAVEAMRLGAYSYITKPFDVDEVLTISGNALKGRKLRKEVTSFQSQAKKIEADNIIGECGQLEEIYSTIQKISKNTSTVFLSGESGTGKELIARAIHYNSLRKQDPFIAINCASIPTNLLESELFGYEKGAFTDAVHQKLGMFELAHKGTLFLDEIADMKPDMQAKLLRVLEEKEIRRLGGIKTIKIDVRIISATNTNLSQAMQDGNFRQDLYYRLNVIPIFLPPLRERSGDVPSLVNHFIKRFNKVFKKDIQGINDEALECLLRYNWPGNIRELMNIIERIIALKDSGFITSKDLPFDIFVKSSLTRCSEAKGTLKSACNDYQKNYIETVLERVKGNQMKAAKILGIHRNALANKIREFKVKK